MNQTQAQPDTSLPPPPLGTIYSVGIPSTHQLAFETLAAECQATLVATPDMESWLEIESIARPCCVIANHDGNFTAAERLLGYLRQHCLNVPVVFVPETRDLGMKLELVTAGATFAISQVSINDPERFGKLVPTVRAAIADDVCQADFDDVMKRTTQVLQALTPRQTKVLHQVLEGLQTKAIALHHGMSKRLIEMERSALLKKFNVGSTPELTRLMGQFSVLEKQFLRFDSGSEVTLRRPHRANVRQGVQ